jgi:hypothetical protein
MSTKLRRAIGISVLATVVGLMGCATTPGKIWEDKPVSAIDARAGEGLEGYDVVAYFTDHQPVKGSDAYTSVWHGVTWKFASAAHRDTFVSDPVHYAPQYGGYCAYAVSQGTTVHGDPKQWAIVDQRLFVNNNPVAKKLWQADRSRNIRVGDVNWPLIPKLDTVNSQAAAPPETAESAPAPSSH